MLSARPRRFERYVALGDSSTEGVDDPDGAGGYCGWSMRLARRISATQGGLLYANFGVRGLTTSQVLDRQLSPALALRPDLATLFCGTNDVTGWRFDAGKVARDFERMQRELRAIGATVLSFNLPDLTPLMPLARVIAPRIAALNRALALASQRTGSIFVDFAAHPSATDARLWSDDRIHANAEGHARIADALAHALEWPGSTAAWKDALPSGARPTLRQRWAAEARWTRQHLLPWLWQGLSDRSAVNRRKPKRPEFAPV